MTYYGLMTGGWFALRAEYFFSLLYPGRFCDLPNVYGDKAAGWWSSPLTAILSEVENAWRYLTVRTKVLFVTSHSIWKQNYVSITFEAVTLVRMMLCILTPCRLIGSYQRFGEKLCLHLQGVNIRVYMVWRTRTSSELYQIKCSVKYMV